MAALLLALARVPKVGGGRSGQRLRAALHAWSDRLHVARAFRSLRWTWAVRAVAMGRLGRRGRRLALAEPVLQAAGVVLMVVWFGLLYANVTAAG
ncbi:MAG: hypothetical protein KDB60_07710 [Propionibacteriaceae bacterium]|nr:hypothetical protein [Propionibacteriaceae bacterium]